MQLFFTTHIEGNKAVLDDEETRHCKVLRKKEGDEIQVINGNGLLMTCMIQAIKKDKTELEIIQTLPKERNRNYYFHLLIAPTKQNERIEWMFEKAIEAGLDEISFIETEHSEKNRINISRLEKIAISAIKQSGQYYLPRINPLVSLKQLNMGVHTFIAHCYPDDQKISLKVAREKFPDGKIEIMIGPEGDFSQNEINNALANGAKSIHLGPSRLRTETAGLYCAILLNGLS